MVFNLNKSLWLILGLLEIDGDHMWRASSGQGLWLDFDSVDGDDAEKEEVSEEGFH
jgi:hypothetical protein